MYNFKPGEFYENRIGTSGYINIYKGKQKNKHVFFNFDRSDVSDNMLCVYDDRDDELVFFYESDLDIKAKRNLLVKAANSGFDIANIAPNNCRLSAGNQKKCSN